MRNTKSNVNQDVKESIETFPWNQYSIMEQVITVHLLLCDCLLQMSFLIFDSDPRPNEFQWKR